MAESIFTCSYVYRLRDMICEGCVQDHKRLSRHATMSEHKASSVGTDTTLHVHPATNGMNHLIGWNLKKEKTIYNLLW